MGSSCCWCSFFFKLALTCAQLNQAGELMPCIAVGSGSSSSSTKDEEERHEGSEQKIRQGACGAGMRVVFLDIDGVLNTRHDPRLILVEREPCSMLRQLLEVSGASLVLTTPWRRHHAYVAQVLANYGVFGESAAPELERTPCHGDGTRRDLEIMHWLGARRGQVAAWAALDASDLLRFGGGTALRLKGHVVQVNPDAGLQVGDVEAALQALGCPTAPLSATRPSTIADATLAAHTCTAADATPAAPPAIVPPEGSGRTSNTDGTTPTETAAFVLSAAPLPAGPSVEATQSAVEYDALVGAAKEKFR